MCAELLAPGPRTGLDRCSTSADTRHVATNSPVPRPWRRHRTSRLALLASAILTVAGCDDSTGPAKVASVQVIPAAWTFTSIGDTVRFRAEAKDAGGGTIPGHTFRWRADPTGVVGIRQDGLATALRPGAVVISATADSVTGTANAGVVQAVSAVHASAPSRLTAITDTARLSFTAVDAHGYHVEDATFSFQSLNEPVATVSPAGTVRAVAPGVARIVVTSSEASDTVTVEVYQFVASMEVTPDSVILEDGTTRQLTAVMKDWKGFLVTDRTPQWRSADTLVATVNSTGVVTAVGTRLGTTAVVATSGEASRSTPVYVFTPFAAVSTGLTMTCALSSRGRTYCWGRAAAPDPVAIQGAPAFSSIGAGWELTCGLTPGGEAYCRGLPPSFVAPTLISSELRFTSLAVGYVYVYGLTSSGAVYTWSRAEPTPTLVPGGLSFSAISTQINYACGIVSGGAAYCWGINLTGGLGIGSLEPRSEPTAVVGGHTFSQVVAGGGDTCGITVDGPTYCWGRNSFGGFGDGTTTQSTVPVPAAGGLALTSLALGDFHTCGLDAFGAAYCWGLNHRGPVGDGTFGEMRLTPVPVSGGLRFVAISAATQHTCGLTGAGSLYCWGRNEDRELGDGTATNRAVPTRVVGSRP